jgi:hypothetical protein
MEASGSRAEWMTPAANATSLTAAKFESRPMGRNLFLPRRIDHTIESQEMESNIVAQSSRFLQSSAQYVLLHAV